MGQGYEKPFRYSPEIRKLFKISFYHLLGILRGKSEITEIILSTKAAFGVGVAVSLNFRVSIKKNCAFRIQSAVKLLTHLTQYFISQFFLV